MSAVGVESTSAGLMKEVVRGGCVVVMERCPGEPNAAASKSAGSPTVGTIRLTTSHVPCLHKRYNTSLQPIGDTFMSLVKDSVPPVK